MRNYEFYTVKGRRIRLMFPENRWSRFFIKAPKGCPLCAACGIFCVLAESGGADRLFPDRLSR